MFRALLALFRPLRTIARELTLIRELYELELSERMVDPRWKPLPLYRITEEPRKGDTEITYQGERDLPKHKRWNPIDPNDPMDDDDVFS